MCYKSELRVIGGAPTPGQVIIVRVWKTFGGQTKVNGGICEYALALCEVVLQVGVACTECLHHVSIIFMEAGASGVEATCGVAS